MSDLDLWSHRQTESLLCERSAAGNLNEELAYSLTVLSERFSLALTLRDIDKFSTDILRDAGSTHCSSDEERKHHQQLKDAAAKESTRRLAARLVEKYSPVTAAIDRLLIEYKRRLALPPAKVTVRRLLNERLWVLKQKAGQDHAEELFRKLPRLSDVHMGLSGFHSDFRTQYFHLDMEDIVFEHHSLIPEADLEPCRERMLAHYQLRLEDRVSHDRAISQMMPQVREAACRLLLLLRPPAPIAPPYQELIDRDGVFVKVPIESLPEHKRSCDICYEKYNPETDDGEGHHTATRLLCGHVYGYECIRLWLAEQGSCPYRCDLPIDMRSDSESDSESDSDDDDPDTDLEVLRLRLSFSLASGVSEVPG